MRTARRSPAGLLATLLAAAALATGCAGGDADDDAGPREPAVAAPTPDPASGAALALPEDVPRVAPETQVYRATDQGPLALDLYLPEGRGPVPVVLVLPGVTPDASPKDAGVLVGWGQALADRGVAAAVVNHRASEAGGGPGSADVAAAVEHLRGIDRVDDERWGVLSFSAGGPHGVEALGLLGERARAAGFVYARTEPFDGEPGLPSLVELLADRPDLTVLAAYGDRDEVPGVPEARRALERADAGRVAVLVDPGGGHGFDASGTASAAGVVRDLVDGLATALRPTGAGGP